MRLGASSTSTDDYTAITRAAAIGRSASAQTARSNAPPPRSGCRRVCPRRPRAPVAPQRLGAAIHTQIASSRTAVATVDVLVRRRDDAARLALTVQPQARCAPTLEGRDPPLPAQRASVSRWLQSHRRVVARIEVTLVFELGPGTTTVTDSRGVP